MPDVRRRLTEMGAVVTPLGSRQFGDYIQAETRKWSDVITRNNITFQWRIAGIEVAHRGPCHRHAPVHGLDSYGRFPLGGKVA